MIVDILRSAAFFLDQLIYQFIPVVYGFIMRLARLEIFDSSEVAAFAGRIYAIIGVIMAFKLAFSLMGAIVNPDNLSDEKKGFGKIIQRSIIALMLIVLVPKGFEYAVRFQNMIINQNIIQKLIVGDNGEVGAGSAISSYTLKAFISCNNCNPTQQTALDNALADTTDLSDVGDLINEKNGDEYAYNYTPVLSTIAGGFILYILIIFCFDIAKRSVKLGFLELLTPVAVVSYASSSAENGVFSRWLKSCGGTYLALFIRIVAITFIAYMTYQLNDVYQFVLNQTDTPDPVAANFAVLFIIIGIMVFGKQSPQFISDLFGIKPDFELDIRKVLGNIPGFGIASGVAIGAGGKLGGGLGAALGGTISAGAHGAGFKNAWSGFGKRFSAGAANVPMKGSVGNKMAGAFGANKKVNADMKTHYQTLKQNQKRYDDGKDYANKIDERGKKFPDKNKYQGTYSNRFADILASKDRAKVDMLEKQNDYLKWQALSNNNPYAEALDANGNKINAVDEKGDAIEGKYKTNLEMYRESSKTQAEAQKVHAAYENDVNEWIGNPANDRDAQIYDAVGRYKDRQFKDQQANNTNNSTPPNSSTNNTSSSKPKDDSYDDGEWNSY